MLIRDMTERECRAALRQADFGRLACARNDQPYIVPVNFSYDGQDLYAVTTLGQKVAWLRSNPLVCLEIDERLDQYRWMSVVVFGRYEEITDTPQHQHKRAYALELLQKRTLWWEPACAPIGWHEQRPPVLYRIEIEKLTGRRATPNNAYGPNP